MKILEITSYIGCSNNCHYCPQSVLLSAYGHDKREMSMGDFMEILKNVPKDVWIDFSGFSEIFCHPYGADLILYAYEAGYRVVLYTTLVGINSGDLIKLRGVKLDEVCFHQYPGADLKDLKRKVSLFEAQVQKGRLAVIDSTNIWTRASNLKPVKELRGEYHCLFADKDFNHNVVLPNGDVYLCCNDYGLKHRLGNLFTHSFDELNRRYVKDASRTFEMDSLCRFCELAQKE